MNEYLNECTNTERVPILMLSLFSVKSCESGEMLLSLTANFQWSWGQFDSVITNKAIVSEVENNSFTYKF